MNLNIVQWRSLKTGDTRNVTTIIGGITGRKQAEDAIPCKHSMHRQAQDAIVAQACGKVATTGSTA